MGDKNHLATRPKVYFHIQKIKKLVIINYQGTMTNHNTESEYSSNDEENLHPEDIPWHRLRRDLREAVRRDAQMKRKLASVRADLDESEIELAKQEGLLEAKNKRKADRAARREAKRRRREYYAQIDARDEEQESRNLPKEEETVEKEEDEANSDKITPTKDQETN